MNIYTVPLILGILAVVCVICLVIINWQRVTRTDCENTEKIALKKTLETIEKILPIENILFLLTIACSLLALSLYLNLHEVFFHFGVMILLFSTALIMMKVSHKHFIFLLSKK